MRILLIVLPDGEVCKDVILTSWSPCNNISTILTSIQYMLSEPDLGFLVTEMATELYLTDREFYNGYFYIVYFNCFALQNSSRNGKAIN